MEYRPLLDTIEARPRAYIPDRVTFAAYGALFAGVIAGFGFGVAITLQFAPAPVALVSTVAPYQAPDICEMPPPSDGIGFHILLDEAQRQGVAAHA